MRRTQASPDRYAPDVRPLLLLLFAASCTPAKGPPRPLDAGVFNSERAWADLMYQVELGPRPAGSSTLEETRSWIFGKLEGMGLTPVRETFPASTPFGTYRMANIYADFVSDTAPPEEADILVLCAHFDTKTLNFRFLGANDGASGVAALLELARVITDQGPRPMTYRFLFLDGEEAMRRTWVDPDNTYGSRYHVEELAKRGELMRVRACVLLDMVGDRDLQLTKDTFSHNDLLQIFFDAAREDGLGAYVNGPPIPIKDDHLPFQRAKIPACDLIDFDYGEGNEHWHQASDLPSNCSAESLGIVGRIVLLGLPAVEERFARR